MLGSTFVAEVEVTGTAAEVKVPGIVVEEVVLKVHDDHDHVPQEPAELLSLSPLYINKKESLVDSFWLALSTV